MLPTEVTEPLKDIGKKDPVLRLFLAVLLIAVVILYVSKDKQVNKRDFACEEENKRLREENNNYREYERRVQFMKDSTITADNKELREQIKDSALRIPSQDSAIKSINKLIKIKR